MSDYRIDIDSILSQLYWFTKINLGVHIEMERFFLIETGMVEFVLFDYGSAHSGSHLSSSSRGL